MTASKHLNKKDGKWYIHLNWIQDGQAKTKMCWNGNFCC